MEKLKIIFDCMIFLQAVMSERSLAFKLFEYVEEDAFIVFVNDEILDEVSDVLARQNIRDKNPQITDESVETFLNRVLKKAVRLNKIPNHFQLSRDPKDEKYINLAVEAKADYIVSRDKDLLNLMTGINDESKEFRQRFRPLKIVAPTAFLKIIEEGLSLKP